MLSESTLAVQNTPNRSLKENGCSLVQDKNSGNVNFSLLLEELQEIVVPDKAQTSSDKKANRAENGKKDLQSMLRIKPSISIDIEENPKTRKKSTNLSSDRIDKRVRQSEPSNPDEIAISSDKKANRAENGKKDLNLFFYKTYLSTLNSKSGNTIHISDFLQQKETKKTTAHDLQKLLIKADKKLHLNLSSATLDISKNSPIPISHAASYLLSNMGKEKNYTSTEDLFLSREKETIFSIQSKELIMVADRKITDKIYDLKEIYHSIDSFKTPMETTETILRKNILSKNSNENHAPIIDKKKVVNRNDSKPDLKNLLASLSPSIKKQQKISNLDDHQVEKTENKHKNNLSKYRIFQTSSDTSIQSFKNEKNNLFHSTLTTFKSKIDTSSMPQENIVETINSKDNSDFSASIPLTKNHANEILTQKIVDARASVQHFTQQLQGEIENYKPPLTRLKMRMDPKDLGSVEVTLISRGNQLHIQVHSNPTAIGLMATQGNELKNQLTSMGFTDVQMQFSMNQQQQQERRRQAPQNSRYITLEEIPDFYESLDLIIPQYV